MTEKTPLQLLEHWTETHSAPDEPLIVAGPKTYSPREMLAEAKAGTEFGLDLLKHTADIKFPEPEKP